MWEDWHVKETLGDKGSDNSEGFLANEKLNIFHFLDNNMTINAVVIYVSIFVFLTDTSL